MQSIAASPLRFGMRVHGSCSPAHRTHTFISAGHLGTVLSMQLVMKRGGPCNTPSQGLCVHDRSSEGEAPFSFENGSFVTVSNRPAEEGRGGGNISAAREETSSPTMKAIFLETYRFHCSTWRLAIMGAGTNHAIEIQAVESPNNETRRSDVFRGCTADCCLP
jgi:hypothetical protein